jgi:hypothetical protein
MREVIPMYVKQWMRNLSKSGTNSDLWTFGLVHLRNCGPFFVTFGLMGFRTYGRSDLWTFGLVDIRTYGQIDIYKKYTILNHYYNENLFYFTLDATGRN